MFRFRPLALWITSFAAGILCAVFTDGIASAVIFAVIGVLCVLCVAVRRFPYRATLFPVLLAAVCGFSYFTVRDVLQTRAVSCSYGVTADIAGDITETDTYGFTMSLLSPGESGLKPGTRVYVYYDYDIALSAGDRVYGSFTFSESGRSVCADGVYLLANGDISRTEPGRGHTLLSSFRNYVCGLLENRFSADTAAVAKAVLTGDRSSVDPSLYSAYRSSGIAHILVISGFHMSLVLMSAYSVLSATGIGRRYAGIICVLLALLFSAFVGFTPSVTRAAVMCISVFIGGALNYKNDPFAALFTALGILLLWNPYSLFSVGLLLSFLCTLGIITVSPALYGVVSKIKNRFLRGLANVFNSVALSSSAALFSFPASATVFGVFSVISPLTNLIVLPLFSAAVVCGYASFVFPPLAAVSDIIFGLINGIARFVNSLSFSVVSTRTFGMKAAAVIAVISLLVICSVHIKRRLKVFGICASLFAACVLLSVLCNFYINANYVSVNSVSETGISQTVAASKQDCVFIDRGGGYTDTEFVYKTGHTSVDVYIMLECDESALSAFVSVLSDINVEKLYISAGNRNPEVYTRVLAAAEKHGTVTEVFEGNLSLPVGDALLTAGEVQLIEYKEQTYYFYYTTDDTVYLDGKE